MTRSRLAGQIHHHRVVEHGNRALQMLAGTVCNLPQTPKLVSSGVLGRAGTVFLAPRPPLMNNPLSNNQIAPQPLRTRRVFQYFG